jgi:protein-tyrosine phosphatase
MTKVIDWKNADDPRDVVHIAVQAVAEGHIVAVPGDCSYLLVGSGLHEKTVSQLAHIAQFDQNKHGVTLMLRSASELLDYFPSVSASIRRLAAKAWPGPITFDLKDSHPSSLLRCLDEKITQNLIQKNSKIRTSQPSHSVFEQMGKLLSGPLVAAPALDAKGNLARNLSQVSSDAYTIAIDDGDTDAVGLPTLVEFDNNEATISREGLLPLEYLKSLSRWTILFVCTGNTCRSPMAQAMMNRKIAEKFGSTTPKGELPIVAISAGVAAYGGEPSSPGASQAIKKYKTTLESHLSSQLTQEMVDHADIILTMGGRHRHVIVSQWPSAESKVHLISPEGAEITDPFGGPLDVYERCAQQLDQHTDYWINHLNVSDLIRWK